VQTPEQLRQRCRIYWNLSPRTWIPRQASGTLGSEKIRTHLQICFSEEENQLNMIDFSQADLRNLLILRALLIMVAFCQIG
jgi:hypothetical protein